MGGKFGKVTKNGKREYPLHATIGTVQFQRALGRPSFSMHRARTRSVIKRRAK